MKATLQQAAVNNAKRLNGSNNSFLAINCNPQPRNEIFISTATIRMFFPHGAIANLAQLSNSISHAHSSIQCPILSNGKWNHWYDIGAIESVYFYLPIYWWPYPSVIQPRAVYNSGAQQQIPFFFRNENILFRVHIIWTMARGKKKQNSNDHILSWPRSLSLPSMNRREMMITLSHHHHHNVVWWLFTIITILK